MIFVSAKRFCFVPSSMHPPGFSQHGLPFDEEEAGQVAHEEDDHDGHEHEGQVQLSVCGVSPKNPVSYLASLRFERNPDPKR